MILVDTGPLVALFDPRDGSHREARDVLERIRSGLVTTMPVLTETFHLLDPSSRGSAALRAFLAAGGVRVEFLDDEGLHRALDLMKRYADHPMNLADASLVAAGERLRTTRIFTLDRNDFHTYRATIGRSSRRFTLVH